MKREDQLKDVFYHRHEDGGVSIGLADGALHGGGSATECAQPGWIEQHYPGAYEIELWDEFVARTNRLYAEHYPDLVRRQKSGEA